MKFFLTWFDIGAIISLPERFRNEEKGGNHLKVDKKKLDMLLAVRCLSITELRCEGLSPQTLTRIRRGEAVKPKTIGKLARVLGVQVSDIIRKEGG